MSFFRQIRANRPRRPSRPPWAGYRSAEDYARALMRSGTDTETARMLMRQARPYFNSREAEERHREAVEYRREMAAYGVDAAAERLMREVGYTVEEESPEGPSGIYYAGPTEWLGTR